MVVRILFVDDGWDELEELRRLTRHKQPSWDMSFACGSNDALRHLATTPELPDVVVADMDLAGIDGIDLLRAIQTKAPRSIRILYSARPPIAAVCRAIPWTHQFLMKPLALEELVETISKVSVDPDGHDGHAIATLAGSAVNLPVLPITYQRVVEIAERDDFSLREVSVAIQDDVALTAETMKLVNSAFFNLRSDVISVEQAVNLLGFDVIRGLVLANSLFNQDDVAAWLDLATLASRSQSVAALARAIARHDGHGSRDQALSFLSGMVHGTGLLLLASSPDVTLPSSSGIENSIDPNVDMRLFGIDRYALGAYLLRLWGFESAVVEAVAGLAMHPRVATSPIPRSLRAANELVAWGGFSVTAFVEGDADTMTMVDAMRQELDKRLIVDPSTAAV